MSEGRVDITKCFESGCRFLPIWAPRLRVPAKGHALDAHTPLSLVMGITFCAQHGDRFKGKRFRRFMKDNEVIREIVDGLMHALRLVEADFARAYVELLAVDSDEWRLFEKMANRPESDALPDTFGAPIPPTVH